MGRRGCGSRDSHSEVVLYVTPEQVTELHRLLGSVRNLRRTLDRGFDLISVLRELHHVLVGLPDIETALVSVLNREFQNRPLRCLNCNDSGRMIHEPEMFCSCEAGKKASAR